MKLQANKRSIRVYFAALYIELHCSMDIREWNLSAGREKLHQSEKKSPKLSIRTFEYFGRTFFAAAPIGKCIMDVKQNPAFQNVEL